MKRIFIIRLSKSGNVSPLNQNCRKYNVVAVHAVAAIEKATKQFKKGEVWAGSVVVESLEHLGPAI